jgi:hypothetical protein
MTKSTKDHMVQLGLVDEPGPIAKKHADKVTINKANARRLIRTMLDAYEARLGRFKYIHHSTHGPQHAYIPGPTRVDESQDVLFDKPRVKKNRKPAPEVPIGSLLHLQYLCLVTLTDHMQDSAVLYANHCRLYADMPWIYTRKVLRLKAYQLAEVFRRYKIGLPNSNARHWLGVAETLFVDFNGDPVALFRACGSTVNGVQKWIKGYRKEKDRNPLLGYKEKITSLYLLYLAEHDALPFPKDAFAVDVHVIFQMYQAGAVIIHKRISNTVLAEVIREMICEICFEEGFDKPKLSNALWLNGSFGCDGCSGNAAAPHLCSIWSLCAGRYATDNYHHNGIIDPKDPLFPKGGEWPKFGVPQMLRRRPDVKGRGEVVVIPLESMFDEKSKRHRQKILSN